MARETPTLSVVALTDTVASLETLIDHLAAQPIDTIELVVVGEVGTVKHSADPDASPAIVSLEVASLTPVAAARAAGVRAASAPIVFLGETHSFPLEDWAEALVAAHEGGLDCVIPTFVNANRPGAVGWAAFILAYGPYTEGAASVTPPTVPVSNCSWNRSVLTGFGDELEQLLTPGSILDERLAGSGGRVARAPEVRLAHLNADRLDVLLAERFLLGRVIGAARAKRWSWARRIGHIAASPLVGPLLVTRALRGVTVRGLPPATIPLMILSAVVQSGGEAVGYAAGAAGSDKRLSDFELSRRRGHP